MQRILAALLAALLCSVAIPALADDAGIVRGTVLVDNAPRASVSVTLTGEGSSFSTTSDARGAYIFSQVPFGHYTVTAMLDGTHGASSDVDVSSDSVARVDLAIVAGLKTIVVTATNSQRGVSGTPISVNTISRKQIEALPGNNSLNNVIETVPGIVKFSYNEPVAHGFHGLTYEIDGAPFPQATSSNFAELIDPKNVDSIEIFTGAMPAEYGGSRQGAVVNILTNRPTKLDAPFAGTVTYGGGNYGQSLGSFDAAARLGSGELFLDANSQNTNRGLDAPTFDAIHDASSQSDQFLRYVMPMGATQTLGFDYSDQLAQFEIPINTDPNNPNDPQVSPSRTDDVQREYDRYANLNFTAVSKDGNGVFQLIPWYRSTRIAYDGDLANDVLATQPDPNTGIPTNLVGLREDRTATYAGIRISDLRTTGNHTIKIGLDANRETFDATQTLAQFGIANVDTAVAQAGTQIGLYAQDSWQPSKQIGVSYGLRYDHSTGFVGGDQISPRIGINIAPDQKNLVHFYYGRFYAAPQLEDVRQSCVVLVNGCPTTPVYDLKPETDSYWEMGVRHQFSPVLSGYVNYFMRDVNNVLDTTQLLDTPIFAVFNNTIGRDRGVEFRLDNNLRGGDSWFASGTVSHSEAAGISGSTFLSCSDQDPTCVNQNFSTLDLQPEDHDQTYAATGAYTHRFGQAQTWFATLQGEYGSGYPVQFESGEGRLPTHLLVDFSIGRQARKGVGIDLDVQNLLNHQYVIKIANGFNTTQISSGRNILLRLTAPF
ncbi:MAG TPA: TonB-dependent receptor [Candidatus Baltobacteraceae bacterium]